MCFGGKSSSQPKPQEAPPPAKPTTFDYSAPASDQQRRANATTADVNSATMLSSTGGETLGAGAPAAAMPTQ